MTWMTVDKLTAEVGKTYKVTWSDCCTGGWFTSKLLEIRLEDDGEDIERLVFEHGEVTDGSIELTEVQHA